LAFNIEVKRIRCTDVERRREAWKQAMAQRVRAVPSGLAFTWDIGDFDTPIEFVDLLVAGTEEIASHITGVIVESDKEMAPGNTKRYAVPGFEGVGFEIRKPPGKLDPSHTSYYGGFFPLPITHNEYKKFGDMICDPAHLGQMRPDMVNIIAVVTDSAALDDSDLGTAVASLEELTVQGDDEFFARKGFKGRADYIAQLERLSGILFTGWVPLGGYPNALLLNDRAKCSIPGEIGSILPTIR
jgi:hypothetical protein